jgi:hypothetical protein
MRTQAQRNAIIKIGLQLHDYPMQRRTTRGAFTKLLPGLRTIEISFQKIRHEYPDHLNEVSSYQIRWLRDAFECLDRAEEQGRLDITVM